MTVVIDKLGEEDVERAIASIDASGHRESQLSIRIAGNGADRIEAVALLGNALLGLPRTVSVDADDDVAQSFPRLGLASAVSRSRHERSVAPAWLCHARWANAWTPASRAGEAMFNGIEPDAAAQFGPDHATFNDPHLTASPAGSSSLTMLLRRWIKRKLSGAERADAAPVIDRAAFFVEELVANVHEHAVSDDAPPIRSQLHVAWQQLAGRPTLTIAVFDTGPGIHATLSRKVPQGAAGDEPQLLRRLLLGELPRWGRGRGIGLSRCFEMVGEADSARMLLATGAARCYGEHDSDLRVDAKAKVTGTVAAITLSI